MGWLSWGKKKSELEEKDRQRNVPPLIKEKTYVGGGGAATNSPNPKYIGDVQKSQTSVEKKLPDDAILTPCYRGDVERVKELLSGKLGKVS